MTVNYLLYFLLIAVIFGLVALVDFIFKKLFSRSGVRQKGKAVRMPRYSFILGIFISLLSVIGLLFYEEADLFLTIGMAVALIMGLYVLVNFLRFGIFYDEDGFEYRTLTQKPRYFRYGDITGQRGFLARSGLNVSLIAAGTEIPLNGAMQGVAEFMSHAFFAWCRETGRDPDSMEFDPSTLSYFPPANL